MQQFCIHCGVKNLYESSPPKFCCGCGNPFNKAITASKTLEVEDDHGEESLPDITSMRDSFYVQADRYQVPNKTFGELVSNPAPLDPEAIRKRPAPISEAKLSGAEIAKKILQECAPPKQSKEVR